MHLATLQNYSRKTMIPIDELGLEFEVSEGNPSTITKPEIGVYVDGMYLEGARFDRVKGILTESTPKILYDPLPMIWFKPIKTSEIKPKKTYDCPVYKTSARRGVLSTTGHSTNFVISIKLPTGERKEKPWILKGVAAL
jgi:dynein heavy chain